MGIITPLNDSAYFDHSESITGLNSKTSYLDGKINMVQQENFNLKSRCTELERKVTLLENKIEEHEKWFKIWNELPLYKKIFFKFV